MPEVEREQTQPQPPICPHCAADPLVVGLMLMGMGPLSLTIITCQGCRKPLHFAVQGQGPQVETPRGMFMPPRPVGRG